MLQGLGCSVNVRFLAMGGPASRGFVGLKKLRPYMHWIMINQTTSCISKGNYTYTRSLRDDRVREVGLDSKSH